MQFTGTLARYLTDITSNTDPVATWQGIRSNPSFTSQLVSTLRSETDPATIERLSAVIEFALRIPSR